MVCHHITIIGSFDLMLPHIGKTITFGLPKKRKPKK
jgi:hypothetical protein